ncbi:hypothetical protein C8R42DRAFT_241821 [Lentinula raphanica]|nr:hypothetical protein C8R42DRAFT_241821 [Lentinula raphanica]
MLLLLLIVIVVLNLLLVLAHLNFHPLCHHHSLPISRTLALPLIIIARQEFCVVRDIEATEAEVLGFFLVSVRTPPFVFVSLDSSLLLAVHRHPYLWVHSLNNYTETYVGLCTIKQGQIGGTYRSSVSSINIFLYSRQTAVSTLISISTRARREYSRCSGS